MRIARHIAIAAVTGFSSFPVHAGPPPPLTRQPVAQRVRAGQATFLIGGSSDPLAGFAWEMDGRPLPGQAAPRLDLRHALPADTGVYQLIASNRAETAGTPAIGETAGTPVSVRVIVPPQAPGGVDLDFGDAGLAGGEVRALVPASDGGVLAAGTFTRAGTQSLRGLARLRPDGSTDPGFTAFPGPENGDVFAAAASGDGWFVGGSFKSFHGTDRAFLVRLLADGRLDDAFTAQPALAGTVRALATQTIEGTTYVLAGMARAPWLVRLHPDGRLDDAFSARLATAGLNNPVYALAVQPDGAVVIGGAFYRDTLWPFNRLGRLLPDGRPDTASFRGPGAEGGEVLGVSIDAVGRIVAAGKFISMHGVARRQVARLLPNGDLDITFKALPKGSEIRAAACLEGGSLIVAGDFSEISNRLWRSLARLGPDGTPDVAWSPAPCDGDALCLALGADGRLFAGGKFGQPHGGVVALRNRPFEEPPRVLAAPSPQPLTLGMGGELVIAALAPPDATYVWHKVGSAEPVATTRTAELMIPRAASGDGGTYVVQVLSTRGTATAGPIDVPVRSRPAGARRHWRALPAATVLPALPDAGEVSIPLPLPALTAEEVQVTLALAHRDTNDLDITLVAPGGQRVSLVEKFTMRRGQDFDFTVFADQAEVKITDAPAPYTGTYKPRANSPGLAALRGPHPAGNWSLVVYDDGPDGIAGELRFIAVDVFGPHPALDTLTLATCPATEGQPELVLDTAVHHACLRHWQPVTQGTARYEHAVSLSGWQPMAASALLRLRREDNQTALAELVLPSNPPAPHAFFRAGW